MFACLFLAFFVRDVNADRFAALKLDGSPLIRGFTAAKTERLAFTLSESSPVGALSALNRRLFQGSTELRWTVIVFPTVDALQRWQGFERSARQLPVAYHSPRDLRPAVVSWGTDAADLSAARRRVPRGVRDPWAAWSLARKHVNAVVLGARVRRALVEVWLFRHPEALRRDPSSAARALPEKRFLPIVRAVAEELVRLAEALPDNQERFSHGNWAGAASPR